MNPIFQLVVSIIFRLKRTCPECKREQAVLKSKRLKSVRCKFCGADMPPHK